jgi:TRAP-type C4-dicarboxylate transport system substrate-binding protein
MRRTVRIATVNPPASATGQACRAFAEAAAKSPVLSAILQVDVVAGGTVGGDLETTQACIKGTPDLAVPASNVVGSLVPELGLLDAPFLFRDADHARGVLDSDIGAEFTALMKPKGSKRSRPSAASAASAVLSNRWPASRAGSPPRSNNNDPPRRRSRAVCRRRPPGLRRSAGISRA